MTLKELLAKNAKIKAEKQKKEMAAPVEVIVISDEENEEDIFEEKMSEESEKVEENKIEDRPIEEPIEEASSEEAPAPKKRGRKPANREYMVVDDINSDKTEDEE